MPYPSDSIFTRSPSRSISTVAAFLVALMVSCAAAVRTERTPAGINLCDGYATVKLVQQCRYFGPNVANIGNLYGGHDPRNVRNGVTFSGCGALESQALILYDPTEPDRTSPYVVTVERCTMRGYGNVPGIIVIGADSAVDVSLKTPSTIIPPMMITIRGNTFPANTGGIMIARQMSPGSRIVIERNTFQQAADRKILFTNPTTVSWAFVCIGIWISPLAAAGIAENVIFTVLANTFTNYACGLKHATEIGSAIFVGDADRPVPIGDKSQISIVDNTVEARCARSVAYGDCNGDVALIAGLQLRPSTVLNVAGNTFGGNMGTRLYLRGVEFVPAVNTSSPLASTPARMTVQRNKFPLALNAESVAAAEQRFSAIVLEPVDRATAVHSEGAELVVESNTFTAIPAPIAIEYPTRVEDDGTSDGGGPPPLPALPYTLKVESNNFLGPNLRAPITLSNADLRSPFGAKFSVLGNRYYPMAATAGTATFLTIRGGNLDAPGAVFTVASNEGIPAEGPKSGVGFQRLVEIDGGYLWETGLGQMVFCNNSIGSTPLELNIRDFKAQTFRGTSSLIERTFCFRCPCAEAGRYWEHGEWCPTRPKCCSISTSNRLVASCPGIASINGPYPQLGQSPYFDF